MEQNMKKEIFQKATHTFLFSIYNTIISYMDSILSIPHTIVFKVPYPSFTSKIIGI